MTQALSTRPRRIRLLHLLIAAALVLLAVRLGEASLGIALWPASAARAAGGKAAAPAASTAPASPAAPAATAASPATAATGAAAGTGAAAATGTPGPAAGDAKEAKHTTDFPVEFTPGEVAVLQDLASRHDELRKYENSLNERERLLSAAEGRLDQRIVELEKLRKSIESLVRQYTDQEKKEMESLVKIYETMKPKDAARILGDLDMRIVLGIMESMKERKSAAILAAMDPERARDVTTELARKREINLSMPAGKDHPSG